MNIFVNRKINQRNAVRRIAKPLCIIVRKKMMNKLNLTSDIKFELKYRPEEIRNRIKDLNLESNILRASSKKRQLGLLITSLHFKNNYDFEIIKKGDFLEPFKSGRGKITGTIVEKKNETSELKCNVQAEYKELFLNLLTLGIIVLILIFGNPESKYDIAIGIVGFLILTFLLQLLFLRLNLKNLKNELIELIEMIK